MNRQSFYTDNHDEGSLVGTMAVDGENAAAQPAVACMMENGTQSSTQPQATVSEEHTPVIPLPNPGEGGPVADLTPPIYRPIRPGGNHNHTVIIPGVTFPCFSCSNNSYGNVRFLNASNGYPPFYIYLGNWLVASQQENGSMTQYLQATSGSQTITIAGSNGYAYIQKQVQVRAGASMTIAIINTSSGLDLMEISDISCNAPSGTSCLRVCNLSLNLGPFDVSVGNQNSSYTPFTNVRYKEVTPYTSFYPGWYELNIARTGGTPGVYVGSAAASLAANTSYTYYIFNAANATDGLKTVVAANSQRG